MAAGHHCLLRAVGGLPPRVPRLRVERAGLAPRHVWRIARVGSRRPIGEVANSGAVQVCLREVCPRRARQGREPAIGRLGVRNSPSEDLRLRSRVVLPVLVVAGKVAIRLAPGVEGVLQTLGAGLDRGLLDVSLGQMFLEFEQVEV